MIDTLPAPASSTKSMKPIKMSLPTLDELAVKWGTDKRIGIHGYTKWYEAILGSARLRPIKLLEIGVQSGASLRMWEDYFPNARIVGMDIDPRCAVVASNRVQIITGSQTDPNIVPWLTENYPGGFDVIIDDGSHVSEHQQATMAMYLRDVLRPGGTYIIEDLHCSYSEKFKGQTPQTILEFLKDRIDDVMMHGACGMGDYEATATYLKGVREQRPYERLIESILFVQSMVMINKRDVA